MLDRIVGGGVLHDAGQGAAWGTDSFAALVLKYV